MHGADDGPALDVVEVIGVVEVVDVVDGAAVLAVVEGAVRLVVERESTVVVVSLVVLDAGSDVPVVAGGAPVVAVSFPSRDTTM